MTDSLMLVPCSKHALPTIISLIDAHLQLRPIVELHERLGADLLQQMWICRKQRASEPLQQGLVPYRHQAYLPIMELHEGHAADLLQQLWASF